MLNMHSKEVSERLAERHACKDLTEGVWPEPTKFVLSEQTDEEWKQRHKDMALLFSWESQDVFGVTQKHTTVTFLGGDWGWIQKRQMEMKCVNHDRCLQCSNEGFQ